MHQAVLAQLTPPLGDVFKAFNWMRPLRNDSEYPSAGRPVATADDARVGREAAASMIEAAEKTLDAMPPFRR